MLLNRVRDLAEVLEKCVCTLGSKEIGTDEALGETRNLLKETKKHDGIVYVIGNGGSAGIASHFCIDLLKAVKIPAQTLYDSNVMSCFSNDYGYEYIFSAPLEILIRPQDLLVAISSSGRSQNIVNGVKTACERGAKVVTLTGFSPNNPVRALGHLNFWLNQTDYGLVESGHFFLLHTIIDLWKNPALAKAYAAQN